MQHYSRYSTNAYMRFSQLNWLIYEYLTYNTAFAYLLLNITRKYNNERGV